MLFYYIYELLSDLNVDASSVDVLMCFVCVCVEVCVCAEFNVIGLTKCCISLCACNRTKESYFL